MADSNYPLLKTLKLTNGYILAHAVRKRKVNSIENLNGASKYHTSNCQNHIRHQIKETIRDFKEPVVTPRQSRRRLPLNMIVSKTATRKPSQEKNADPLSKFDLSTIRNAKLMPPQWREKHVHTKRLQAAHLHNKRTVDQIQALKAQINTCPQLNPDELTKNIKSGGSQHLLSEMQSTQGVTQSQEENPSQLYCGNNGKIKSVMIETEDPRQQGVTSFNPLCDEKSNEKEYFKFDPTPAIQQSKNEFFWNPVIVPPTSSTKSAREILKENFFLPNESSYEREPLHSVNSPGNCSTSSGLTIAEERVQLTYYAKRCKSPSQNYCNPRRFGEFSFCPKSGNNPKRDWLFHSPGSNFKQYFEE